MVDKLNTLAERIKFLRKKSGLSLAAVAKQLEVSPQAVHKWENGGNIDGVRTMALAELFNVNASWVMFGEIPEDEESGFEPLKTSFKYAPPSIPAPDDSGTFVPLLELKKVRDWVLEAGLRNYHTGEWVACPAPHGQSAFAVRVEGVSMEKAGDRVSYSPGDIIFVDPEKPPVSGSRVIVDWSPIDSEWTSLFRELIVEGDIRYIRALNPTWPDQITRIYENRVLGTVIGKWVQE